MPFRELDKKRLAAQNAITGYIFGGENEGCP
jgi:hypothetical protein